MITQTHHKEALADMTQQLTQKDTELHTAHQTMDEMRQLTESKSQEIEQLVNTQTAMLETERGLKVS